MVTQSSKQWLDWIWAGGIVIMAALLLSCASVPPPNDALSTAKASNDTVAGRQENRRVEIVFAEKGEPPLPARL